MLEIGSVIDGKYKILNKIGQGGMGIVYLAMNEKANKQWAIKEVRKDGRQNYEIVKQSLIAETDILKRLSHPNLPSIIDIIDGEDTFLIVMDYIEGRPLDDVLKEQGVIPQEQLIHCAIQLCDVLGYLHSRQPAIIYRDMKPSNVMLKPNGDVMLFDFGTAREFKGGQMQDTVVLGTRGYAAPEQYGGRGETDARTDIFCLGATLYHLVTGHNPSEPPYKMYPIRYWNPALSSGLEEIILKCTQPDPNDRYQSCAELMYDLEHYREKDADNRKRLKGRLRGFIISASAAVLCAAVALGFRFGAKAEMANTYEAYISSAERAKDGSEMAQYYIDAIHVDPSKLDAYLELLEVYKEDGVFEYSNPSQENVSSGYKTEAQVMDELLDGFSGSGYDLARLNYEIGIATYYYADGKGNKPGAASYFKSVLGDGESETGNLDPSSQDSVGNFKRAQCLCNIGNYYNNLYTQDRSGQNEASYSDYWNDMKTVINSEQNLVQTGNYKTALVVYKDFVTQIRDNVKAFLGSGVTREDIQAQLANVAEHLDSDFTDELNSPTLSDDTKTEISNEIAVIATTIEQAQEYLDIAVSKQNSGGDAS